MPISYYQASVLIFLVFLAVYLYKERGKIERHYGILFIKKTQRGRNLIESTARAHPVFWKHFGNAGVVVGFLGMVAGVALLVAQALKPADGPGLSFILPVASAEGNIGFGYVGIPFWYFLISIGLLVIVHEGMHGVLLRREGVKLKTLGLMLLAIIPGAFVEPDEKSLRAKPARAQLRVYAAGAFANFVLAAFAILLLNFVLTPIFSTPAIGFAGYVPASQYDRTVPFPAELAQLKPPILSIDGTHVATREDLQGVLSTKKPGDVVNVETTSGVVGVKLAANPQDPEKAFLGVGGGQTVNVLKAAYRDSVVGGPINFTMELLYYIFLLNLGVGIVNLFPIGPLDGGRMLDAVAKRFVPNFADDIVRFTTGFMLILILWNFVGGLIV